MTQSPRELAAQKAQLAREQKRFLQDLLEIVDSLERAGAHWQKVEQKGATISTNLPQKSTTQSLTRRPWWSNLGQHFLSRLGKQPDAPAQTESEALTEVVVSAREGVEMIRRELLEVLSQRQVVPLSSVGQAFNPEYMYAVGRRESESVEENTVVEEVLRGYLWQNKILREAQVIVSSRPSASAEKTD